MTGTKAVGLVAPRLLSMREFGAMQKLLQPSLDPSGKWPGRRHSEYRSSTARPPLTRSVGDDESYQLRL